MDWLGPLGLGPEAGVFRFYMYFGLGQSEAAPKNAPPWMMDGSCMDKDTFFHWGSEIGVHQTGCPQKGKTRVVCSWVLGGEAQEVVLIYKWFGVGLGILELGIGPVLFQAIHEYLALGHHKLKTLGFGFL
jgi:hypothetical protein